MDKDVANITKIYHSGFTIIELVVTIMILAIMSATVIPRFLTSKGLEEYTYQDELLTKLKAIQLRAMQETSGASCRTIKITDDIIGLLPSKADTTSNECLADLDVTHDEAVIVKVASEHDNRFSVSENLTEFSFTRLGRPTGCLAKSPCEITLMISGETLLTIHINAEGYIYAL